MVGQGGGNLLLNQHAGHAQQRFALDITEINAFGFRAAGLAPGSLDRYEIFGAMVVSPCDGQVVSARDGLPDLTPPERDRGNPAGNHVIVDCGGFQLELAHLRSGSVKVAAGDRLHVGGEIGRVGNSGNTSEPHLHVHAVDPKSQRAVPLTFAGRWLVRNSLLTSSQAQPDG